MRNWIQQSIRFKATLAYIVGIVIVNAMFAYLPSISVLNEPFSPADVTVGIVYILRDLAQREIHHKVFYAMLVGGLISYSLASKTIAFASVTAFLVGEMIEWLIFTITRQPMSKRLLWSAMISVPIDSYIFLYLIDKMNWVEFGVITSAKFFGILLIWLRWRQKALSQISLDEECQLGAI